MPLTPNQLLYRRVPVTFDFAGETLHIEYYPAILSGNGISQLNAMRERIQAATTDEDVKPILLEFGGWMARLLASWDYLENPNEDGTPGPMVPLTAERIAAELERFSDFITACATAAVQDYQAGKTDGAASSARSDATSSPTER